MHATDLDPEQYYGERFPSLVHLALASNVPIEEAQALAHEVLLGSLLQLPRITDLEPWLEEALRRAIAVRNAGVATGG